MSCATCNAAAGITDSTEHTGEGRFVEKYECANGHTGRITGNEEAPPTEWKRMGPVFNDGY